MIKSEEILLPPLFQGSFLTKLTRLNPVILLLLILWAGVGIIMLFSAAGGSFEPWAKRQTIYLVIGFCMMLFLALTNPDFWLYWAYGIYGLALLLLGAVELVGTTGMGARRWLDLGILRIQPSELMKPALILALSGYFHKLSLEDTHKLRHLLIPIILIVIPVMMVIRQPDLGTAIVLMLGGVMVLFLAGVKLWKFYVMAVGVLLSLPIAWNFILHDYQKRRILIFLEPEQDPLGAGYHITQSKIALGSGGLTGRGYMEGTQSQYNFLPEKHTDFIFTMLGEEFGLRGTFGLLFIFCLLVGTGTWLALRAQSQFNRLLAFGLINNFALYVMINIAMVTGMAPVVGLPLPMISYGGSAIISVLLGFGLILMVGINRDHLTDLRS